MTAGHSESNTSPDAVLVPPARNVCEKMAALSSTATAVSHTAGPVGPVMDQRQVVVVAPLPAAVLLSTSDSVAQLPLTCSRGVADRSHSAPPTETEYEPLLWVLTESRAAGAVAKVALASSAAGVRMEGEEELQNHLHLHHDQYQYCMNIPQITRGKKCRPR